MILMEFCEKCGSVMLPSTLQGKKVLTCKCGNLKQLTEMQYDSYKLSKRIEHSLKEEFVSASQIDKWKQGKDFSLGYDIPLKKQQKLEELKTIKNVNYLNNDNEKSEKQKHLPLEKRTSKSQEKLGPRLDNLNIENKKPVQKSYIIKRTESGIYRCLCDKEFEREIDFFYHFKSCRNDLFFTDKDGILYCTCGDYFLNALSLFYHFQTSPNCLSSRLSIE